MHSHITDIKIAEIHALATIEEYGVKWEDGSTERAEDKAHAEELVRRYREWAGKVQIRTITVGSWEDA